MVGMLWFLSVVYQPVTSWKTLRSSLDKGKEAILGIFVVVFVQSLKSYLTLCDSMDCSMPGFLSITKLMSIESMIPSNHLILCCPLLLLPSIFPSIRFFSNESVLPIRWLKYWSFSFSMSPSNEYSGLISFRID